MRPPPDASDHPVVVLEQTYLRLIRENGYVPVTKGRLPATYASAPTWTREECIALLRLWVVAYGRLPMVRECIPEAYLPDKLRVRELFGSHQRWIQEGADCVPPKARGDVVRCLKCDRWWPSPDKRRVRICRQCKHAGQMTDDDSGAWMNGAMLRDAGTIEGLEMDGVPS